MKLSEYLFNKVMKEEEYCICRGLNPSDTKNKIEKWIVEWYKETYDRLPPMWLVKGERK